MLLQSIPDDLDESTCEKILNEVMTWKAYFLEVRQIWLFIAAHSKKLSRMTPNDRDINDRKLYEFSIFTSNSHDPLWFFDL